MTEEEITISKAALPALLRAKAADVIASMLSDDAVAKLIGPDGESREHSISLELPDGQSVLITISTDVFAD